MNRHLLLGQEKVADLLIQKGSNLDTVDIKGYTPLLEAVNFGKLSRIRSFWIERTHL